MLSARSAILTTRRGMTLGVAVRILLATAALTAAIAGPMLRPQMEVTITLSLIGALWILLSLRSAKAARISSEFPLLVARGELDQAETQVEKTLQSFSLFRPAKLLALHQLAVLRHAQDHHADAAALCREVLAQRLGPLGNLTRSSRLILAQSSLELGDARTAGEALAGLSAERLSVGEGLNLLALQLDYQSRIGAWGQMFDRYMTKVQMAEVMPSGPSAVSQALLALAAKKIGRDDAAAWLCKRAAILADAEELVKHRPMLGELWTVGSQ